MLTVVVLDVPTPFLAVHWYWIRLSLVPGLVTFATVSEIFRDKMTGLPPSVQTTDGEGTPLALQIKVKFPPSMTVPV